MAYEYEITRAQGAGLLVESGEIAVALRCRPRAQQEVSAAEVEIEIEAAIHQKRRRNDAHPADQFVAHDPANTVSATKRGVIGIPSQRLRMLYAVAQAFASQHAGRERIGRKGDFLLHALGDENSISLFPVAIEPGSIELPMSLEYLAGAEIGG